MTPLQRIISAAAPITDAEAERVSQFSSVLRESGLDNMDIKRIVLYRRAFLGGYLNEML